MKSSAAFCPGHISGYFKRISGPDYETTGSIGAGIVISEGVLATVFPSELISIEIRRSIDNGRTAIIAHDSLPLRSALEKLDISASVTTECNLPIGAGFGLSAAALLATITALNRLYDLRMSEREVAVLAHETEILHRTGLGDVTSCRGGGMVVRPTAGIDAPIKRYLDPDGPVFAISFGPIHTPSVLGSPEQMKHVAAAFPQGEPKTLPEFFSKSRQFTKNSGLLTPQVADVLEFCDRRNVLASMTMLGNGVFAYGYDAEAVLAQFGRVYRMAVANVGPVLLGGYP